MLQNVDGIDVYVVVFTEAPRKSFPVNDGGNSELTPYAEALNEALLQGMITESGKYGVHVGQHEWNVFKIIED